MCVFHLQIEYKKTAQKSANLDPHLDKYILLVFCVNIHPHSCGHFKSVLCQQSELINLRCDVFKVELI